MTHGCKQCKKRRGSYKNPVKVDVIINPIIFSYSAITFTNQN